MASTTPKSFVKGFKYPIYPTLEQEELLARTFGCCRYVYNRGIADAKRDYAFYQAHKAALPGLTPPTTSGYDFVNKLTPYKRELECVWLSDVSSVALQQTMMHLGDAFSRFYKARKGFPVFKKKQAAQSFSLVGQAFTLRDGVFTIAKSKTPMAIIFSRPLPSAPTSCTISRTPSGKYYASFTCEYIPVKTHGQGKIGIDLGLKDFLVTSDGERVANPKPFVRAQRALKRAQQALARKRKGSCNRTKARVKVAQAHERTSNKRSDFLHKLSRRLVNENQVIGVEKLRVANMVRNRHLSKAIQDVGWRSFTTMLDYKAAESQNCSIVYMDSFFPSSHLCSTTKQRLDRKLSLSERTWTCPHCDETHDRDLNAAINIRDEALETLKRHAIPDHAGLKVLGTMQH